MAKTKEQKQSEIKKIREDIAKQTAVYFVDFAGLKNDEIVTMKKELKQMDAKFVVVKKTLARIALKEEGIEMDTKNLKGEIAFVFSFGDQFTPTKPIVNFAKTSKNFNVLGGFFQEEGKVKMLTAQDVIAYSAIPGRQELYAQLAYVLNDTAASFARVIDAIREKNASSPAA